MNKLDMTNYVPTEVDVPELSIEFSDVVALPPVDPKKICMRNMVTMIETVANQLYAESSSATDPAINAAYFMTEAILLHLDDNDQFEERLLREGYVR